MKTDEKTLTTLMHLPQRLRVPLFQRPYAWSRDAQWEPLWQDLVHLLELPNATEKHFLGAVVLQSGGVQPGGLPSWDVIDGQQRLTTLQVLIDAVASVIEAEVDQGGPIANRLTTLTENHEMFRTSDDDRFKLTPTTRDRQAFIEVMSASAPDHAALNHREHALVKAHKFFVERTRQLLDSSPAEARTTAAVALAEVVLNRLEIVVITLDPTENAQAIFETMNARMTPLQPTDLIKNLLFQRASAEGEDVEALYRSKWQRFEDPFWESEVTQGRLVRPRFTIFMNYWLTSQTGASVMSGDVFRDFKRMLQAGGRSTVEVLDAIVSAAEGYRQLLESARRDGEISRRELTVYRLLESDVGALWPVLLYLLQIEQERRDLSAAIDRSFALLESWVVRRTALSMTMSGVNRQVIDMLDRLRTDEVGPDEALERYLRGLRGDSAVWPDDAMIRSELTEKKVYTSLKRSRLRMILEALEDEARGFVAGHARTSHSRMVRRATEVEHIMPTSWREHWPLGEDGDEVARDRAVNTIGNLALLPQRFNASIQNIEWGAKDGRGKRAAFHKSSADLLLHDVLERDVWDEAEIAARSRSLVDAFIQTWPVPEGHSVPRAESSGPRPNVIRELIERGALREGDVLVGRGQDRGLEAIVTGDGALHVEGERYDSPTAAAMAHKTSKGADSGNSFWRLGENGPSLLDLRAQVLGFEAIRVGSTSTIVSKRWALLRLVLRALPLGTWTTYGDVADVIRSHANPVGQHIAKNRVEHAWRVLQAGGTASPGFRWTSEEYQGADPMEMLAAEGVGVVGGVADPSRRLRSSDLRDLLDVEGLTLLAEIEGAAGLSVAALADELSIRPEVIRVWLRAKPGAESAKQSSEWLLDQELADWIREHHASAEGDVE